jgi:hypothetical protein
MFMLPLMFVWSWVERICRIFLLFCYICIVIGDPIIRGEYCSWRGVLDTTLCDSLSVTFDRLMHAIDKAVFQIFIFYSIYKISSIETINNCTLTLY